MASSNENLAYLAGLVDGEGSITYKQYWDRKRKDRPRKYFCWRKNILTRKPPPSTDPDRSTLFCIIPRPAKGGGGGASQGNAATGTIIE